MNVSTEMNFVDDSVIVTGLIHPNFKKLKHICIGNTLKIDVGGLDTGIFTLVLSKLIYPFTMKHLTIINTNIKFEDFLTLTDSTSIKYVAFLNVQIIKDGGLNAPLDDFVERFPNAHTIE
uniref:Uncharacterized protein n=1 Tax=Panagrolaimus davidi TaxID=227884 RepID=A0A914QK54_9BILA